MKYLFTKKIKQSELSITRNDYFLNSKYRMIHKNKFNISFYKNYFTTFHFYYPIQSEEVLGTNKYFHKQSKNSPKEKIFLRNIRYKPGYQVIWRFYRKSWVTEYYPYNFRQVRLTKILYNWSSEKRTYTNMFFTINNAFMKFNDVARHVLNWKYIT